MTKPYCCACTAAKMSSGPEYTTEVLAQIDQVGNFVLPWSQLVAVLCERGRVKYLK